MKYIIVLSILCLLQSCNDEHYKKKKVGNYLIEASFINDSIIDGKAKVYNLDGKLESIVNYNKGIKNGFSLNFHSNGKVYDSINFMNGLENGYHYVYDSSGKVGYIDFYLNGHQFGPEIFYKNGIVNTYYFGSFEKFELYNVSYDEDGRVVSSKGNFINASFYETNLNGVSANGIFSYFIYPPNININYELISKDTLNKKEMIIRKFKDEIFIDTVVNKLEDNSIYCIKAILKDSLDKEKQIFYEELISTGISNK